MRAGQNLVDEHFPLLEPFGVTRLDIFAIVDECNHDPDAVAEKVAQIVDSKIQGRDDNILWHTRTTPQAKRKHSNKRKENGARRGPRPDRQNKRENNEATATESRRPKKDETPKADAAGAKPAELTKPIEVKKSIDAGDVKKASSPPKQAQRKPEGITHVSKPKVSGGITHVAEGVREPPAQRQGKSWADRVKGQTFPTPTSPEEPPKDLPEPVKVEQVRSTTVFSWVAAAQGRRAQPAEEEQLPPESEEVEDHQPVPDRVFDISRPKPLKAAPSPVVPEFEELPPPAGFETEEEPRRPYRQIVGQPTIKQRAPAAPKTFAEPPANGFAPRPPMSFERPAYPREFVTREGAEYPGYPPVDPYYMEMQKQQYGMPYPYMQPQKQTDETPYNPPMMPPAYYEYERDYYMKARQMAAEQQRRRGDFPGYRGAPMPPMFAAAAGRSEMAMVGATNDSEVPLAYGMMQGYTPFPRYPSYQAYQQSWRQ